jgi:hypothetical protein
MLPHRAFTDPGITRDGQRPRRSRMSRKKRPDLSDLGISSDQARRCHFPPNLGLTHQGTDENPISAHSDRVGFRSFDSADPDACYPYTVNCRQA